MKIKPKEKMIENNNRLKIPLIERLLKKNMPYVNLKYQKRMKSLFVEFFKIISGQNSGDIIEDTDINNKENVKGMVKDMFFINYNIIEQNKDNKLSDEENTYEAKYLAKLAQYLLKQGYKNDEIVILTFYESQRTLIQEYTNKLGLKDLKVETIENYKGEECNIVLLSLAINNNEDNKGNLNSFENVYTAFSRAKIGFYIIGNFDNIKKIDSNNIDSRMIGIWEKIIDKAKELNIIGDKLVLECQNQKN